ncbi:hypothetical protein GQX74_011848 [Glossina fuscipes]|nr:hypothetical protein GQX74_011848 [Glossina fuscipes]
MTCVFYLWISWVLLYFSLSEKCVVTESAVSETSHSVKQHSLPNALIFSLNLKLFMRPKLSLSRRSHSELRTPASILLRSCHVSEHLVTKCKRPSIYANNSRRR